MSYEFSATEIRNMKYDSVWRGQIDTSKCNDPNIKYKLHATGEANTIGRIYIALPANLKITNEIMKIYNIL